MFTGLRADTGLLIILAPRSINFLMARPSDFEQDLEATLARCVEYVKVELAYHKEHALLKSKAEHWLSGGKVRG